MAHNVIELNCPGCGARVSTGQSVCEWCNKPIVISTFNSVYSMPMPEVNKYANSYRKAIDENPESTELNKSIAICYLKLGIREKALEFFEKAIAENFDDSESYFYAAICLLNGKKAFLTKRDVIDKILEYIEAALMIEPKGIYYYFLAYIKYDFFARKRFKTSPDYNECLATAYNDGLSQFDIDQLYSILGVSRPDEL